MDSGFAQHRALTVTHILPAALFMVLMPLQFIRRIRERRLAWHRWSGRVLVIFGFVAGISALMMSYTMAIARHCEWMIRAFGVVLGIATTRPIVGVFFAAQKLSPHEFFGISFWLGFTLTLVGRSVDSACAAAANCSAR
jgi:hypothetical protein